MDIHKSEEIKKDTRVSRVLWFAIGFLCASSGYFVSCKTEMKNINYKITDSNKKNYYTNAYEIKGDSICFLELNRNRTTKGKYTFAINDVKILSKEKY